MDLDFLKELNFVAAFRIDLNNVNRNAEAYWGADEDKYAHYVGHHDEEERRNTTRNDPFFQSFGTKLKVSPGFSV